MGETTQNKVAIITGGATGIGRQVATKLASLGINIVLAGRNKQSGDAAAAEIAGGGAKVIFVQTDVSRESDVINLVEATISRFGRIDYLFNNAGVEGAMGPIEINTEQVVDEVLAANVKGVFLCTKHVIPGMIKQHGGIIVNVSSFVGTIIPFGTAIIYGASKAAVLSMTQSTAAGFAEQNINVFAVCPWVTDTPMIDRLTGFQPEAKAGFGGSINPSGTIALPEDIAAAVADIFSGENKTIKSGEAILVDRGGSINKIVPMGIA